MSPPISPPDRLLAAVFETDPDAILAEDPAGIIREWSAGAERIYGYSAAEAVGQPARLLVPPDRLAEWEEVCAQVRAGRRVQGLETARRRKDGGAIDVALSLSPLAGAPGWICTIAQDLTEKRRLLARLTLADRMASVGALAAGVAHEINNPLSAIYANIELALGVLASRSLGGPGADEIQEMLQDAAEAARRVQSLVYDLRVFSQPKDEERGLVDVRDAMDAALRMVAVEIRQRARLARDYGDVAPIVHANQGRLGQVFLNLLINAAQALPRGNPDQDEIRVQIAVEEGRVLVSIRDTGEGIPPEAIGRIFEPFFTLRPGGGGTGLGLSLCQEIVAGLGGEIAVESEPGRGTTVRVALPAAARRPAPAAPRRARVLLVDEEAGAARALAAALQPHHEVDAVTDAHAALERLRSRRRYDALLCDLATPQLAGINLYLELRQLDPELASRTIFLTSAALAPAARAFLQGLPNPCVEKPAPPSEVLALIQSIVR